MLRYGRRNSVVFYVVYVSRSRIGLYVSSVHVESIDSLRRNLEHAYLEMFTDGACTVRERFEVRMLQITPQTVNAFDVNVTYVQPYSRTTYVNDIKYDAVRSFPTSILNMTYPCFMRGNFPLEKALHKRRLKMCRVDIGFYIGLFT